MKVEIQEYSPQWVLNKLNTCETDAHKLMVLVDFRHEIRKEENQLTERYNKSQEALKGLTKTCYKNKVQHISGFKQALDEAEIALK